MMSLFPVGLSERLYISLIINSQNLPFSKNPVVEITSKTTSQCLTQDLTQVREIRCQNLEVKVKSSIFQCMGASDESLNDLIPPL